LENSLKERILLNGMEMRMFFIQDMKELVQD